MPILSNSTSPKLLGAADGELEAREPVDLLLQRRDLLGEIVESLWSTAASTLMPSRSMPAITATSGRSTIS
jgi:hypothetical protein